MRKILSLVILAGIVAPAFAGGHKRGCDCEPPCTTPPVPQEVTPTVYALKVVKQDVTFLVEKRVPRELVTRETCLEQVPGCCEPKEVIVEKRCPVTEIVLVPQRQTVRFVTLEPLTTLDIAVPEPVPNRPICPPQHGDCCGP